MSRNEQIIARLLAGGVTMATLAKEYGITRERVRQIVNGHGHSGKSLGTRKVMNKGLTEARLKAQRARGVLQRERLEARRLERTAKAVEMKNSGASQREIALELGVCQGTVSDLLISAGLRAYVRKNISPPGSVKTVPHADGRWRGRRRAENESSGTTA